VKQELASGKSEKNQFFFIFRSRESKREKKRKTEGESVHFDFFFLLFPRHAGSEFFSWLPQRDREKRKGVWKRAKRGEEARRRRSRPSIGKKAFKKTMISFPAYVALSALSAAAVVSYAFATREQCVFSKSEKESDQRSRKKERESERERERKRATD